MNDDWKILPDAMLAKRETAEAIAAAIPALIPPAVEGEDYIWACPNCKRADKIDVCADVWVRIVQPSDYPQAFGTDADEAETMGEGPAFDGNHGAICRSCGYHGNLDTFETSLDSICATCGVAYADGGDGHNGDCPECADKLEPETVECDSTCKFIENMRAGLPHFHDTACPANPNNQPAGYEVWGCDCGRTHRVLVVPDREVPGLDDAFQCECGEVIPGCDCLDRSWHGEDHDSACERKGRR